jgi:hypothetical protein
MQWIIRLAVATIGLLFAYTALPATFTFRTWSFTSSGNDY